MPVFFTLYHIMRPSGSPSWEVFSADLTLDPDIAAALANALPTVGSATIEAIRTYASETAEAVNR